MKKYSLILLVVLLFSVGWSLVAKAKVVENKFTFAGVVMAVDTANHKLTLRVKSVSSRTLVKKLVGQKIVLTIDPKVKIYKSEFKNPSLKDLEVKDKLSIHGVMVGDQIIAQRIVAGNNNYLEKIKKIWEKL